MTKPVFTISDLSRAINEATEAAEARHAQELLAYELTVANQAAEIERLRVDAERYRWLSQRLLAADFDWNETGKCVLVFDWPSNVGVGGNCDKNIDAAMKETP